MSDEYNIDRWPLLGKLFNGVVVPCEMSEWSVQFTDFEKNCRVGSDHIEGAHVSTVFLGIQSGHGNRPLWFETMIFDLVMHDKGSQPQWRYETLAEAKEGHARACAWVREHMEVMRAERRDAITSEVLEAQTPRKEE
jgi:hypothetical protein